MYDHGSGLKNVAKIVGQCILAILVMAAFVAVLRLAIDREEKRLDAVRESNCAAYGVEINGYYGREICPPTVHG